MHLPGLLYGEIALDTVKTGILSAACRLPEHRRSSIELFHEEGVDLTPDMAAQLGVERVPICNGQSGSDLAVAASLAALQNAAVPGAEVDVVVDYTILPQEWMVPVWNMSGKVQKEIGAEKAFTVGFSGGGATNFLVALNFTAAMLEADEKMKYALLVGADVTIPGNRILNPSSPVSVLGDGASAMLLQRGAPGRLVLGTEILSDGANHDIYYIPGGCLANPEDPNLYRMVLDKERYDAAPKTDTMLQLAKSVLDRAGLKLEDVKCVVYPNISVEDQEAFRTAFGLRPDQICTSNLATHGHMQGNDLVLNYLSLSADGKLQEGDYILICSHGMGFMAGASLIRI
jgi:3-oxoacyl-[acyl-carrier-protein] synthase-3